MNKKLMFLTKMSLNKKIKTKWFYIANLIFALLIIGLINIDTIINAFGGDFEETQEIIVIDEINKYNEFKESFESSSSLLTDYVNTKIELSDKKYEDHIKEIEEDNKIVLIISEDETDYIKAKVISNEKVGAITSSLINSALTNIHMEIALEKYNISSETYHSISKNIIPEMVTLSEDNEEDDLTITSIMQIITMPLFMLIIFLVQMIGAEVNEEKTTRSMEIIISNVSPKTHFLSKIISANLFVIIQGTLLFIFGILGLVVRYFITGSIMGGDLGNELGSITNLIDMSVISKTIQIALPILLIMILLTFFAYSLLAGILASMTTNLEDFQQLQTPIVIISLIGYYLSMMTTMFKGSIFIKIMGYLPLISSMLAPTLYVLGEISLIDLLISIALLIGTIYILITYGLRIYKVGILNYSGNNLWKKMFKALRRN